MAARSKGFRHESGESADCGEANGGNQFPSVISCGLGKGIVGVGLEIVR